MDSAPVQPDLDTDLENVRRIVREHYERSERPLFLAQLGQRLPSRPLIPLRQLLESKLSGELAVVVDAQAPKRIAVAPVAKSHTVRAALSQSSPPIEGMLRLLPRTLLYAFSKPPSDGRVFYWPTERPRYEVASESPGPDALEIEPDYRKNLRFAELTDLDAEVRREFADRIGAWMKAHGLALEDLRRRGRSVPDRTPTSTAPNALTRLIQAQPPDILGRMVIPGDVAALLMRSP